jgi:hypothetical protein
VYFRVLCLIVVPLPLGNKPFAVQMENNKTPWPESATELYRHNDSRLLAKLVATFEYGGCHVVSVTDQYGRILCFLDR